jgi:hypothetical protein
VAVEKMGESLIEFIHGHAPEDARQRV